MMCLTFPFVAVVVLSLILSRQVASSSTSQHIGCPRYNLNFDDLDPLSYVGGDDLENEYLVHIEASGTDGSGHTPNGAARVWNISASPLAGMGTNVTPYDIDDLLGMNNVLIIQESDDASEAQWNGRGGNIKFTFTQGVHLDKFNVVRAGQGESASVMIIENCDGDLVERTPNYDRARPLTPLFGNPSIVHFEFGNDELDTVSLTVTGDDQIAVSELVYYVCEGSCEVDPMEC